MTTQPPLPPGKDPDTHWTGGCVGLRAATDVSLRSTITFFVMCQHPRYRIKCKKHVKLVSYSHVFRMKIPSRNFALTFYVEWVVRISSPFPLQSHPLTFFMSFFLLTSLRLDMYRSAPPYSRLTISYLKIWHGPSVSIFIPRRTRNKLKGSQYAIIVCFTVTCTYSTICLTVMVSVHEFMAFKPTSRKIFNYTYVPRLPHFVVLKHALERPSQHLQHAAFTHASVYDPDSNLSSTLLPSLSPASILKPFNPRHVSIVHF